MTLYVMYSDAGILHRTHAHRRLAYRVCMRGVFAEYAVYVMHMLNIHIHILSTIRNIPIQVGLYHTVYWLGNVSLVPSSVKHLSLYACTINTHTWPL
jgi:hypothetical protein